MARVRRSIVPILLCIALAWIGWTSGRVATDEPPSRYKVQTTCQEDMACWDCTTMGNQICGPNN